LKQARDCRLGRLADGAKRARGVELDFGILIVV
jgi:hypothetical protein